MRTRFYYDNIMGKIAKYIAERKVAIPCHFWMFAEQNGDRGAFIEACKKYAPNVTPVLISQGKEYHYCPNVRF